jgi:cytochrome c oxidase accessory protein FixG
VSVLSKFGINTVGAAREWIHPASVSGHFTRLRLLIGRGLIAFLIVAPWLRVDGRPVILADLSSRQVFFFGAIFTPRDSILLLTAILSAGLLLFFVTSIWGRLWCGYACPQTVLLEEIIRRIEKWTDGERGARLRLQNAPWTAKKVAKRALKWGLFLLVAVFIAMSFTGFFSDTHVLWTGRALPGTYAFVAVVSFALWLDFAWFREQFCAYLCPYARLQGVLTDDHTVQIGYDVRRGEPRKPKGVAVGSVESGACIDCNRCVAVCPAGIDIREGFQLECIACAKCVDACTEVLGRLGEPTLVLYDSLANLEGRPSRSFRARPWIYGVALLVVGTVFVTTLARRAPFDLTIAQDARTAESVTDDGGVRNLFQLTIHNNTQDEREYEIAIDLDGAELTVPGAPILVPPAGRRVVPAFVTFTEPPTARVLPFEFTVRSGGDEARHDATFRNQLASPK